MNYDRAKLEAQLRIDGEEWRPVAGFPLYEVSNRGQLRVRISGRIIAGHAEYRNGVPRRLRVSLARNDKRVSKYMHQLVLETFVGPCPVGLEGCHNDGNPFHNDLSNLRWDTHSSNALDSVRHGTQLPFPRGHDHPLSKLNLDQIIAIRSQPERYGILSKLAREYGVSATAIMNIRNRKVWTHV